LQGQIALMQEVKAAQDDVTHSIQQLRRFTHMVVDHVRGALQRRALKASVAAAHEAVKAQNNVRMKSSAEWAARALTSLRSQTNAHTDAAVRKLFSIISHSARRAADSHHKALVNVSMTRAAVDICLRHMHVHSQCQHIFRVKAHVSVQQAAALQFLITEQRRSIRATHAVRECWRSVLLRAMHKAAADACILSSQNNARMHAACARVFGNKCAAAAASNASDAAKRRLGCIQVVRESQRCHDSVAAAFSHLRGCASQAELNADRDEGALLLAEPPMTEGTVQSERPHHTRARFSSAVSAKQLAKQLANINARSSKKRMSDYRLTTTEQVAARRFTTHSVSVHRPRASSSKVQQSEPLCLSGNEQDLSQGHFGRASGNHSRFSEASVSQRMFAQQPVQMQEVQKLDAVADELSDRLQTLPDRLRSRACSRKDG
jgi:hypothetical protein